MEKQNGPSLFTSLLQILFPEDCLICGQLRMPGERALCRLCLYNRFERLDPDREALRLFLPVRILFRCAMWRFDKGGDIRELLHHLKYGHVAGLGWDLGYELGRHSRESIRVNRLVSQNRPLLVPVPLHPATERKRGYNQAVIIARGVSAATGWPVLEKGVVTRVRQTDSQTGLSLEERRENVRGVFRAEPDPAWRNHLPILVDDVFTTGATTFELMKSIVEAGAERSGILTVAEA
ncbi:MAG: ComF family protein [Balneolaceae bacterium]